jgi:hypothetical protein
MAGRRWALLLTGLLLIPLLGGCIFPYCAYPTLAHTPAVALGAETSDVRAFRVDITKAGADLSPFDGPEFTSLAELPVTLTNEVPSQTKPSVSYGLVVIGVALNFITHTSHDLALRLYRPGYATIEVKSWERANLITWSRVTSLADQEKAVDDLFPHRQELAAGSVSAEHRQVLLFGAAEYERLAASAAAEGGRNEGREERLLEKAQALRDLAAK